MNSTNGKKGILFGIGFILTIVVLLYLFMNPSPIMKYGKEAVEDGKAAVRIADQCLDYEITVSECQQLLALYQKDCELYDKGRLIYTYIDLMLRTVEVDGDLFLEDRNALADMLNVEQREWQSRTINAEAEISYTEEIVESEEELGLEYFLTKQCPIGDEDEYILYSLCKEDGQMLLGVGASLNSEWKAAYIFNFYSEILYNSDLLKKSGFEPDLGVFGPDVYLFQRASYISHEGKKEYIDPLEWCKENVNLTEHYDEISVLSTEAVQTLNEFIKEVSALGYDIEIVEWADRALLYNETYDLGQNGSQIHYAAYAKNDGSGKGCFVVRGKMEEEWEAALTYKVLYELFFKTEEVVQTGMEYELAIECGDIYLSPHEAYNIASKKTVDAAAWCDERSSEGGLSIIGFAAELQETIQTFSEAIENNCQLTSN